MYPSSSSRPDQSPQTSQHATAHLTQTMTLLGLSGDDLLKQIEDEMYNNPALDIIEDRHCPSCNRPLSKSKICTYCSLPHRKLEEEAPVFVSSRFETGGSRDE